MTSHHRCSIMCVSLLICLRGLVIFMTSRLASRLLARSVHRDTNIDAKKTHTFCLLWPGKAQEVFQRERLMSSLQCNKYISMNCAYTCRMRSKRWHVFIHKYCSWIIFRREVCSWWIIELKARNISVPEMSSVVRRKNTGKRGSTYRNKNRVDRLLANLVSSVPDHYHLC